MSQEISPSTTVLQSSSKEEIGDGGSGVQTKAKRTYNTVTIPAHIQIHSDGPNTIYECTPCGRNFKTKYHIRYHAYCQNKEGGDKPFKCAQCEEEFATRGHYQYHLLVHTGERPVPCSQCGKAFRQRGSLTQHQRSVHDWERPFACDKAFTTKETLQNHIQIHTGDRPLACKICEKRFTYPSQLKSHVRTHTGERPFSCDQCGKGFALKGTLNLHLATHSGERPFLCDQCAMAFACKKDLRRHCRIHANIKPWKCMVCDREYGRKDHLERHVKKRHSEVKRDGQKAELIKPANKSAAKYRKGKVKTVPKPVDPVLNSMATQISIPQQITPSYPSSSSVSVCAFPMVNPFVNNTSSVIMFATPVVFVPNVVGVSLTNFIHPGGLVASDIYANSSGDTPTDTVIE